MTDPWSPPASQLRYRARRIQGYAFSLAAIVLFLSVPILILAASSGGFTGILSAVVLLAGVEWLGGTIVLGLLAWAAFLLADAEYQAKLGHL